MKWLFDLEHYNIAFNINILRKNESIIASYSKIPNKRLYILDGYMQKMQIFTNGETLNLQLLYSNDTFTDTHKLNVQRGGKKNYHHQFRALTKTILIVINEYEFMQKTKKLQKSLNILNDRDLNKDKNNEMIKILSHKNTKKRLIQLLLLLIKHFGTITEYNICLPFSLSSYTIASIIGSQRVTVNRIMNRLKPEIIYYDKNQILIIDLVKLIEL